MKITQEEVVDRQTVLRIELEDDDMGPYLDRGYRKVVQHTAVPGFRRGKAPRLIIERYLGRESLIQEALDFLLPDVTQRAIEAQDLETAGAPSVELLELDPVTVKATVALTPKIDLGSYGDIRVEETPVEITEEDKEQRLQELQKAAGTWEPVERPVEIGDMVTMDATGHVEESYVLDNKDAVYSVEEDNHLPFPGFAQNLIDMEVGTPREFLLDIPDDNTDARLAGKEAHCTVTISEIKERHLPELDDEFAKGLGEDYETLAELREAVASDLDEEAEKAQKFEYREAVLDRLVEGAVFELPPLLIDHAVQHMVERRDRFVDRLDIGMDEYLRYTGKSKDEIEQEMRESTLDRFRRSYALATLAESEGLQVSDEEVDERTDELKSSDGDGGEGESAIKPDLDSDEARSSIREMLLVAKAVDRLVSIAQGEAAESSAGEESPSEGNGDPEQGGATDDAES